MTTRLKIDFVSDVSCPWCVIGLLSLERALANLGELVAADLHFQPFELNPDLPAQGQDIDEYMMQKYGATPEQTRRNQEAIRARGEELGFIFRMDRRTRTYNTFDAHRLLHWAGQQGRQQALEHALFEAYFSEGQNPGAHDVLIDAAGKAGLDQDRAREIVSSNEFADEVRQRERFYLDRGIHAVPAVIINDRHLIQGGQPVQVFEQALRNITPSA